VPEDEYTILLGKADIKKEGDDVTIITYSKMVLTALEAAKELDTKGIHAEVLDLRTLVPLDFDAIKESVSKTGRVLIVHEACERSGYGAEIAAQIADKLFDELDAPILRVCGVNIPVPNATIPEVESAPTVEKIVTAVERLCQGGKFRG
jgi:pyruvate dehydrogenase E1 component beta subunit